MIRVTDAASPEEAVLAFIANFDIVVLDFSDLSDLMCLTNNPAHMVTIMDSKSDWEFTTTPLHKLGDILHIRTPFKKINEVIAALQEIFPEMSFEIV